MISEPIVTWPSAMSTVLESLRTPKTVVAREGLVLNDRRWWGWGWWSWSCWNSKLKLLEFFTRRWESAGGALFSEQRWKFLARRVLAHCERPFRTCVADVMFEPFVTPGDVLYFCLTYYLFGFLGEWGEWYLGISEFIKEEKSAPPSKKKISPSLGGDAFWDTRMIESR